MDNPEKLQHRVQKTKKNKTKTQHVVCVAHHYTQTNKNKVNRK